MNGAALVDRLARGSCVGLASWWLVAALVGGPLPWALPGCVLVASALLPGSLVPAARVPRWSIAACLAVLVAVLVAIGWGSLATPSRHWDGAAAWDPKAAFLIADEATRSLWFQDPNVFAHSPDYPLLQPMLMAALHGCCGQGRLLFPLLLALAGATLFAALRRQGSAWIAWTATVAMTTTPTLVSTTSGAADSGYAELLAATCLLVLAVGMLLDDASLLAAGIVLTIGAKPEGTLWSLLPVGVAFLRADRRQLLVGAAACVVGHLLLWWLRGVLLPTNGWSLLLPIGVGVVGVVLLDLLLRRADVGRRGRLAALLLPVLALGAVAFTLGRGLGGGVLAQHLQDVTRLADRWTSLPQIVVGMFEHGIIRLHFGATFLLPLVLLRPRPSVPTPARGVALLLLFGLAAIPLPFLLAPEDDIDHHVKSSMPRLLLQWIGVTWLLTGVLLRERLRGANAKAT
ncbi:MAG: hypothetical protein IPK26_19700 [Planctomycetes bacterium]|nr:hypothetical protein [Planctomycetota bacterium]